jgi:hypothetical protein
MSFGIVEMLRIVKFDFVGKTTKIKPNAAILRESRTMVCLACNSYNERHSGSSGGTPNEQE